jgi:hypothetical protein
MSRFMMRSIVTLAFVFSTTAENAFSTTRSVDLSAYAGQTVYIAFRNTSDDMY